MQRESDAHHLSVAWPRLSHTNASHGYQSCAITTCAGGYGSIHSFRKCVAAGVHRRRSRLAHPHKLAHGRVHLGSSTAEHVRRIAAFCDVQCDETLVEKALLLSSTAFMEQHSHQFDDHWLHERQVARQSFGQFPLACAAKVSLQQTQAMSEATRGHLRERWRACVQPATGAASYEELCAMHRDEVASGHCR